MTIVALDVLPYALPLAVPLVTARGTLCRRAGCLVRLRAADGSLGIGDAAPHPHDGERGIGALRAELAGAARWLVGASLDKDDELLDAAGRLGGAAAMGVDVALHDLLARRRGLALVELLGGSRRPVAASALLGADPVRDAQRAAVEGYTAAKLKVAADPRALTATVDAIRRAAPDLTLRLDANGAWSAQDACAVVEALPPLGIAWLEQPVAAWDLGALGRVREVARARGLRIAADEAVTGPDAVRRIAAARAADVVVLKLVQVGGLRRALATAEVARAAGIDVVVTTGLDTGFGTAAALHLAAALQARACAGAAPLAAGVATSALLPRDVVRERIVPGPAMALPHGPGLGVTLDEPALGAGVAQGATA